jgi:hypothetical protein
MTLVMTRTLAHLPDPFFSPPAFCGGISPSPFESSPRSVVGEAGRVEDLEFPLPSPRAPRNPPIPERIARGRISHIALSDTEMTRSPFLMLLLRLGVRSIGSSPGLAKSLFGLAAGDARGSLPGPSVRCPDGLGCCDPGLRTSTSVWGKCW